MRRSVFTFAGPKLPIRQRSLSTFAAAAGVAAACLCARPCHAIFSWIQIVPYNCSPAGLDGHRVFRVYAVFSNPGDRLVAVRGDAASPITITSTGTFYQNPSGGNLAPDADSIAKDPALAWDTFCTIGLAKNINGADQTTVIPPFPQLPVVSNTHMTWLVPGTAFDQGAPDAGGRVLFLQTTMPAADSISQCKVGITYRPAGTTGLVQVNNLSLVLLPGIPGDVNNDLQVNINDLLDVINTWGQAGQAIADANDDGLVDIDDLLMVINMWGSSPGDCGS